MRNNNGNLWIFFQKCLCNYFLFRNLDKHTGEGRNCSFRYWDSEITHLATEDKRSHHAIME